MAHVSAIGRAGSLCSFYSNNRNYRVRLESCVWDPGLAVRLSVVIGGVAMLFWPLDTVRSFHCTGRQIALLCTAHPAHTTPNWPAGYIPDALGRVGGPEMQVPGTDSGPRPIDADLGVTSSKGFPAKPRQSGCEPASQQSLRGMEASIDFFPSVLIGSPPRLGEPNVYLLCESLKYTQKCERNTPASPSCSAHTRQQTT